MYCFINSNTGMDSWNHHCNLIQNSSITRVRLSQAAHLCSHPPLPQPLELICSPPPWFCLWDCYAKQWYNIAFDICFAPSARCLWESSRWLGVSRVLSFSRLNCNPVFTHPLVPGHSDHFQLEAVRNRALLNVCVHVSVCVHKFLG